MKRWFYISALIISIVYFVVDISIDLWDLGIFKLFIETISILTLIFIPLTIISSIFLARYLWFHRFKISSIIVLFYCLCWLPQTLYFNLVTRGFLEYKIEYHYGLNYVFLGGGILTGVVIALSNSKTNQWIRLYGILLLGISIITTILSLTRIEGGEFMHLVDSILPILIILNYYQELTRTYKLEDELLDS